MDSTTGTARGITGAEMIAKWKALRDEFETHKVTVDGLEMEIVGYDLHRSSGELPDVFTKKRTNKNESLPDMLIYDRQKEKLYAWTCPEYYSAPR